MIDFRFLLFFTDEEVFLISTGLAFLVVAVVAFVLQRNYSNIERYYRSLFIGVAGGAGFWFLLQWMPHLPHHLDTLRFKEQAEIYVETAAAIGAPAHPAIVAVADKSQNGTEKQDRFIASWRNARFLTEAQYKDFKRFQSSCTNQDITSYLHHYPVPRSTALIVLDIMTRLQNETSAYGIDSGCASPLPKM